MPHANGNDGEVVGSAPARSHSRGFALIIVLWSMAMLALIGTQLTATARVQLRLAALSRDRATAEAAADGATRDAIFLLLGGERVGSAGLLTRVRVGEATVDVTAEDEADKIDPNAVSKDVLRGLLVAVGVDQARAALLAGEIADWRNRSQESVLGGLKIDRYRDRGLPYRSGDHGFYSIDEMGLIADMTPDILARLRPWLSVYHEGAVSDPNGTSLAAAAVGDVGLSHPGSAGLNLVSKDIVIHLTAVAIIPGRARFVRSAIVRIRAEFASDAEPGGDMVQILTWE